MNRGRKRRKRANMNLSSDQPSTSSTLCHDQETPPLACAEDAVATTQEEELGMPESKKSRIDDDSEEPEPVVNTEGEPEVNTGGEPEVNTESEPVTIESPSTEHSQEDVMIIGDVQVARPEVIDLERLPTIRQGGSVVVDLTSDTSSHDSNVVDLTRENALDSSIDSSPVIVCVNRIYRGDPFSQRPSCRFATIPSTLDIAPLDDEIEEVVDSSDQNAAADSTSSSTSEGNGVPSQKSITCPICWEDETTLKRRKRQLTSTTCGHVFCDQCIRNAVKMQYKCPTCRKKLTLKQLHPIFL